MIGELIGNFRILARLGEGGMGEVFVAEQQQIRTKVAIKMLLPKISENHEIVQRFFNEAIAVSKIQHSGIAKIFDVGFHGMTGRAYLVMEFLDGETLASRMKRGRMSLAEVAEVGRQIASVFDAVSKAGITHRDLKPDNIFLVPDAELPRGERVKVLDFGIAKLGGAGVGMTSTSASSMGTPLYMSPEQWMSSAKVDWRADAYSLGCVTYEMLVGQPPFWGESMGQLCAHHLTTPPPRAGEHAPVPPALDTLISRLLSKAPEERPASMREIGAVFASLDGTSPAFSAGMSVPQHSAPMAAVAVANTTLGAAASSASVAKKRRSPIVPIVAGLVLAGGLGVGAVVLLGRKDDAPAPSAAPAVAEPSPAAASPPAAAPPSTTPPAATPPPATPPAVPEPVATQVVVDAAVPTQVAAAVPTPEPVHDKPGAKPATKPVPKPAPPKPDKATPPPTPEPVPPPPPPPDPNLPERIDRPMIKAVIAGLRPKVKKCHTKSTSGGFVVVKVAVNPDGTTANVVFEKTPDDEASECARKKIEQVAFPPTRTGGSWRTRFEIPGLYIDAKDLDDAPEAPKKNRTRN